MIQLSSELDRFLLLLLLLQLSLNTENTLGRNILRHGCLALIGFFFLRLNFFLGENKLPLVVAGISDAGGEVELGAGSDVVVVVVVVDFLPDNWANFSLNLSLFFRLKSRF